MSRFVCLCAVALAFVVFGVTAIDDSDIQKFESLDVSKIMSNKRLRTAYISCMLDKGPCTADAAEMKKMIPELQESFCSECSSKLKATIRKSINMFKTDYPEDWALLIKHFDPEDKQKEKLEKFMKESD